MKRAPSLRELRRNLPENVAILPTAAPQKVRQRYSEDAHAERRGPREAHPWPGEYLFPSQREAIKRAEVIRSVEQSAALRIAFAVFAALDEDTRGKARTRLAMEALSGSVEANQALEIANCASLTIGEQVDLNFAFKWLAKRSEERRD